MIKFCKSQERQEEVYEGTSFLKILQFYHFNIFGMNDRSFRKMPIKKIINNRDCSNFCRFPCSNIKNNANRKKIKFIYRTLEILQNVPNKESQKEIGHRKSVDRSKSSAFVKNAPWILLSVIVGRKNMLPHFLPASERLL